MRGRDTAVDEDQHGPGHEVGTPVLALLATLAIAPPPASASETLSMEATVEVRTDPKLGMRVPVRMMETYQQRERGRTTERIDGTAAYSNFRRFETSGRIIQCSTSP